VTTNFLNIKEFLNIKSILPLQLNVRRRNTLNMGRECGRGSVGLKKIDVEDRM